MNVLTIVVIAGLVPLAGFGFWKLTRYFWLKIYYRYQGVNDVGVATARALSQKRGLLLLDVREPDEYDEAHVDGVTLIPLGQLVSRTDEIQAHQNQPLLIICRGGVRSAKACLILEKLGFEHPLNVAGGMTAWKRSQLPFVSNAGLQSV